eukprot:482312-Amphidinium_carterae.2
MFREISPNRMLNFDVVAELASIIVNRASQFGVVIVYLHQRVFHWTVFMSGYACGYICRYIATGNDRAMVVTVTI